MKKLSVAISQEENKAYDVLIGKDLLRETKNLIDLSAYSNVAIVTDSNLKTHLHSLKKSIPQALIIELKPGEKYKNIMSVGQIWEKLSESGFDRKSLVINLGGGVITDIGGFAASTYMRGIDFINVPTTLLSQVDASIGGKTGIDFASIKNLIGTFDQPKKVIIDIETLKTLPVREHAAGFAEIIKHGLIKDKIYFEKITSKTPSEFNEKEIEDIVCRSIEIKKEVVENDERESGERKILNFGHTIGHAIEALSLETDRPLLHGEAIGLGMLAEGKISEILEKISESDLDEIKHAIINAGLPDKTKINYPELINKITKDKKNSFGETKWTLLEKIGKATPDIKLDEDVVRKAIEYVS